MTDYSAIIRDHLIQQHAQSLDSKGNCAYRTKSGNKCAIGCLIPDTTYIENLEGVGLRNFAYSNNPRNSASTLAQNQLIAILPPDLNIHLAARWQMYHDYSWENFSYTNWLNGDESQSPTAFHNWLEAQS